MTPTTVVVGAGRGIGRAVAHRLADRPRLALLDADTDALAETAALLAAIGTAEVVTHAADVTDAARIETVVDEVDSAGPVTELAHVAGILETGSVLDADPESWRRVFEVNVFGVLGVLRAVGRRMRERGAGSIVVVGSNAAGVPRMSMGAYGSSKAAVHMLTRVLGLELAQYGIRANIVAPGSTDTDMQRSLWPDPADDTGARSAIDGDLATYKNGIPLGRIASADDIADTVEYLLSPRAQHVTMQALYVDGGATLRA